MTSDTSSEPQPGREQRHRMANTLQFMAALARLRGQRISDEEAKRELAWMAAAIGSIGALEQRRGADGIDFSAYLADMAPVWAQRHGAREVRLGVHADPLNVSDQAGPTLCLIVQELVGNALTHGMADGRAGRVDIGLAIRPDRHCVISVEDDGDGFDPESPACKPRFGLWLAKSLAAQVRGKFDLTPKPGVRAELIFPLD